MAEVETSPERDQIPSRLGYMISSFGLLPLFLLSVGFTLLIAGAVLLFKPSGESVTIIEDSTSAAKLQATIRVDIEGAVEKPGVYSLTVGSRVQDALVSAGGLSEHADREYVSRMINRAERLRDGGKIYIPSVNEISSSKMQNIQVGGFLGESDTLININTASASELDRLSGVGPVTAQKIIDGRPYQIIDELLERKIVNKGTWEKIKNDISTF